AHGGNGDIVDASLLQLKTQRLGKADHCPFTRGITAAERQTDKGTGAGDIDQMPASACLEVVEEGVARGHQAEGVDAEGVEVIIERHLLEGTTEYNPGIVDQHIDAAMVTVDLLAGGEDAVGVADIEQYREGAAAEGVNMLDHLHGGLQATRRDQHVGPLFGQFLGHQGANAGPCPGNQYTHAGKIGHNRLHKEEHEARWGEHGLTVPPMSMPDPHAEPVKQDN